MTDVIEEREKKNVCKSYELTHGIYVNERMRAVVYESEGASGKEGEVKK